MSKSYIFLGLVILVGGVIWLNVRNQNEEANANADTAAKTTAGVSGSGTYAVNTTDSVLHWEGRKHLILNYVDNGIVKLNSGKLVVLNGNIISGDFTIDMKSIEATKTGKNTGESYLTKHLMSADFFDADKFPESKFVITSVTKNAGAPDTYEIIGDLTIKGITKPIVFNSIIRSEDDNLIATGNTELDRTNWDIRYGSGKFFQDLGDNVIDDKFSIALDLRATLEKK